MRPLSDTGLRLLSELSSSGNRPRVLFDAVSNGRAQLADLPELIAFAWLNTDEPTQVIDEAAWTSIYRSVGFFSWPIGRKRAEGPTTLYRGSTESRARRMSWAEDCSVAETLGTRHSWHQSWSIYKTSASPQAILAALHRRGEGWTIVVDPTELTQIEKIRTMPQHQREP